MDTAAVIGRHPVAALELLTHLDRLAELAADDVEGVLVGLIGSGRDRSARVQALLGTTAPDGLTDPWRATIGQIMADDPALLAVASGEEQSRAAIDGALFALHRMHVASWPGSMLPTRVSNWPARR